MTDYSKFKTPFFKISIGDSSGKNMRELPPHIARLVEKVEITETLCCNTFNQINISLIEGSREPYKVSEGHFANPDDYEPEHTDLLSNRSGLLTDLRITSSGLSAAAPGSTALVETVTITPPTTDGAKDNTPPEIINITEEINTPVDDNIHYLFHQRNQIEISWGYKEDELSVRKTRAYILIVTTDFPESGSPRTNVVCHSASAIADQLTTNTGRVFGKKIAVGTDDLGNDLYDWKDDTPADLIASLGKESNTEFIVSPEFRAPVYEAGKAKHWMGGQSLHQFLLQLAVRHHAIYDIIIDVNTGKDTIIFLNRDDFESYPIIKDEELLTYKANGSIVKSVSIKADFGMPVGTFLKGISEEGGIVKAPATQPSAVLFGEAKLQNNFPDTSNPARIAVAANTLSAGGTSASSAISVEASSPANVKDGARAIANKMGTAMVSLDFTTLGFPQIVPGSAKFSGIGERYTGYYKIQTVTHTLDSNGYNCKGNAISYTSGTGGVQVTDPVTKKAAPIKSDLFGAATQVVAPAAKEINEARTAQGITPADKTNGQ